MRVPPSPYGFSSSPYQNNKKMQSASLPNPTLHFGAGREAELVGTRLMCEGRDVIARGGDFGYWGSVHKGRQKFHTVSVSEEIRARIRIQSAPPVEPEPVRTSARSKRRSGSNVNETSLPSRPLKEREREARNDLGGGTPPPTTRRASDAWVTDHEGSPPRVSHKQEKRKARQVERERSLTPPPPPPEKIWESKSRKGPRFYFKNHPILPPRDRDELTGYYDTDKEFQPTNITHDTDKVLPRKYQNPRLRFPRPGDDIPKDLLEDTWDVIQDEVLKRRIVLTKAQMKDARLELENLIREEQKAKPKSHEGESSSSAQVDTGQKEENDDWVYRLTRWTNRKVFRGTLNDEQEKSVATTLETKIGPTAIVLGGGGLAVAAAKKGFGSAGTKVADTVAPHLPAHVRRDLRPEYGDGLDAEQIGLMQTPEVQERIRGTLYPKEVAAEKPQDYKEKVQKIRTKMEEDFNGAGLERNFLKDDAEQHLAFYSVSNSEHSGIVKGGDESVNKTSRKKRIRYNHLGQPIKDVKKPSIKKFSYVSSSNARKDVKTVAKDGVSATVEGVKKIVRSRSQAPAPNSGKLRVRSERHVRSPGRRRRSSASPSPRRGSRRELR